MMDRELYFISGSPPCWTVMLALEVKSLTYTPRCLRNTKLEQKSPEYLAINARGQVPTLIDSGITVCETLAILAYLDTAYPTPPLFDGKAVETARIWQTICECDSNLRAPIGDISRPLFRGKGAEFAKQITEAAATVRKELALLETRLSSGPWLTGKTLSAADLIAFPMLMQLERAAARDEARPMSLDIHPFDTYFPNIATWQAQIETLPGFLNAYPPHWVRS
jgi:glutathione S-transferase